ncbi:hypothetical protein AAMO2058_001003600 [Amorphochlora amoebiformis]
MASLVFVRPVSDFVAKYPFFSQIQIAWVKTALADVFVQTKAEGKSLSQVDTRRTACFALYGATYLGAVQYGIYVKVFRRFFDKSVMDKFCNQSFGEKMRNKLGIKQLLSQLSLDNLIVSPFLAFPVFYSFKEFVNSPSSVETQSRFLTNNSTPDLLLRRCRQALAKYRNNFWRNSQP